MIDLNKIYNEDCIEGIKRIPDNSIDCILTDPPYLYLKKQRLDREFDELDFFKECKRVLKKDAFIVLFGRGTSFYRWNCILADIGFDFKEEIIWDKCYNSSPLLNISRVHESISIHSIGKTKFNKCRIPYIEMQQYDNDRIIRDIKRLCNVLSNPKSLQLVKDYIENGTIVSNETQKQNNLSISSTINISDRSINTMRCIKEGIIEKTVIRLHRDHYNTIHPTQKPIRLMERLLALVSKEGDTILDPFSGSASTAIACINTQRNYIGFEIVKEYYDLSIKRISEHQPKLL